MTLWAGLGYYARARNLHRCARVVCEKYRGQFPDDPDILMALPGIGRSTAGAIVAQAFDQRAVILDGNVKRVLARYRAIPGWPGKGAVEKRLWALADELTPDERCADYTQAIMDLGATLCTRNRPRCPACPLVEDCVAFRQGNPDAYPQSRPKKSLPTREIYIFLCYQPGGRIMLERRPPTGIWGGLWSLPQCTLSEDPADYLDTHYGYKTIDLQAEAPLSHCFTHFRLHMKPLLAQVQPEANRLAEAHTRWCTLPEVDEMGMPRPVQKLVTGFLQSGIHWVRR